MEIHADNFTKRETKSGKEYLNFHVLFAEGDLIVYSQGWQVFGGLINPPSYMKGRRFFPNLNLSPEAARMLYDAVAGQLPEGFELTEKDVLVKHLTLTMDEFKRLYPSL